MSDKSNRLLQFWNELKRRKVIKVIAMYAGTSFIILEVVDIIAPSLGLPNWTLNLVIVLLCIGFPISVIFSWIFDFTPEGLTKTEPGKTVREEESPPVPIKRRLKPSDGIITVLIVVVAVLAYPKIFKKNKLEDLRDQDGRISIAVMPFENLSGDTLYNVWRGGFQNLLISTLSNSEELLVRQYQAIYSVLEGRKNINYASLTPSLASELAEKLESRTFVIGNILKAGNKIRINVQLVNAESEEIYKTYQVDGNTEDDILDMADSLSGMIKNYLEIKKLVEQYDSPAIRGLFTNSSEAYQYYIHGYNAFMDLDLQTATEWFSKAIETDPDFITAYVQLSFMYRVMGNDKLAKGWCKTAYKKRHELPLLGKLMLDHLNAYYFETPNEQIKYINQILEIDELNVLYWYLLGRAYYVIGKYEDAAIFFGKALEIHKNWGIHYRNPFIYGWLGNSYHQVNEHKKENEVYQLGLTVFPEYGNIISSQATCALTQGNMDEAEDLISQYQSIRSSNDGWSESRILSSIGYIYSNANLFVEAEKKLRQSFLLDPQNPTRINDLAWFLINNDINVDEGMGLIEKALAIEPEDWYAIDTKGWGLYKQGKFEEALKVLNNAWDKRLVYSHEGYLHIQAAEKALANRNNHN